MKHRMPALSLLFALHLLPWAMQPAHAQGAAIALSAQREDEFDGRQMQNDYRQVYTYGYKIPAYSAEEVTETSRTLADGNQIRNSQTSLRYRDQAGRVRIAYKSLSGAERIFIADPDARVAWLLRPNRHDILRVTGVPSSPRLGGDYLAQSRAPDWNREVKTSLGVKDVAGVKAAGTLVETYYAAGARGNEKEMVETVESWRSGELALNVYWRRLSPSDGERVVRLENLKFADVPESLFAIPADQPVRDIVLAATQAAQ